MPERRIDELSTFSHGDGHLGAGLTGVGLDPSDQDVAEFGAEGVPTVISGT